MFKLEKMKWASNLQNVMTTKELNKDDESIVFEIGR